MSNKSKYIIIGVHYIPIDGIKLTYFSYKTLILRKETIELTIDSYGDSIITIYNKDAEEAFKAIRELMDVTYHLDKAIL